MSEVPLPPGRALWRKSSTSADGDCLEFTCTPRYVWVRDSKNPTGPTLGLVRAAWAMFLIDVRRDEFSPYLDQCSQVG